jgi:hypothetical protein
MFENRMLRRIFGAKRDGVMRKWKKLLNEELNLVNYSRLTQRDGNTPHEELNDLHSSPNIIRVMKSKRTRWVGYVALMGEKRSVYRVLVRKPNGKSPIVRPWRRWDDNITMYLLEVGSGVMDWIELAQDRDSGGHL